MKIAKKLLALLLVAMMIAALGVSAFAAGTSTLTINTTDGHTYLVYQMLTGDVSGLSDGSGTLANVAIGSGNNAAAAGELTAVEVFDNALRVGGVSTGAYLTDDALAEAAEPFINGTVAETVVGNGSAKSVTVADGYYIVKDTWTNNTVKTGETLSRYMVAVVGDTTISPKATTTPDIDKNITDEDANAALETGTSKKTDTAAIGDVINYAVTGKVPDMTGYEYYYYVLTDTMSAGLTLNDANDAGFTVTVGNDTLVRGTDYYVYKDGQTFKLAFADMKNAKNNDGTAKFVAGSDITVAYSATINENAATGVNPNTNTVTLTYSNQPDTSDRHDDSTKPGVPDSNVPTGVTPDRVTKTYVAELDIQKTNGAGDWTEELKGATFTLTGTGLNDVVVTTETYFKEDAAGEYYKLNDGTYTKTAPDGSNSSSYASTTTKYSTATKVSVTDDETGNTSASITAVVTSSGTLTFKGLRPGTYTLAETNTPTGYTTASTLTFTISATQSGATAAEGGAITWAKGGDDADKINLDTTTGIYSASIKNVKGNQLPSTGGMGTTLFYVIGGILVIGAGVVLVSKKRMEKA